MATTCFENIHDRDLNLNLMKQNLMVKVTNLSKKVS